MMALSVCIQQRCVWAECEIFEGAAILVHSLYYEQQQDGSLWS